MLDQNLVLKSNELFTAGNTETDGSREMANGLYLRDTRHLSLLNLTLNGQRPESLSVNRTSLTEATIVSANPFLTLPDGTTLLPQLLITQTLRIADALTVDIAVQNYSRAPVACSVEIRCGADFRDLFDIRGFARSARGSVQHPVAAGRNCQLSYRGLDLKTTATVIVFSQDAMFTFGSQSAPSPNASLSHLPASRRDREETATASYPTVTASFPIALEPGTGWDLRIAISPQPADGKQVGADEIAWPTASIVTSDPSLNAVIDQSLSDLAALDTVFPDGPLIAAGIPWFVAPFGRDSLIAALQTLHVTPERAINTLRTMAALQGTTIDAYREEEPGKIPHEMRYGEMARLGEVPHTPYFGTVDATPLWLWLFAETVRWTGDRAYYDELKGNAVRAVDWCEQFGDLDGDGLIEYKTDHHGPGTITHQVWKDSFDSLHHADGTNPDGPIAAVEVQAYAYAGYRQLADVAREYGDREWAADLDSRADRVRDVVEKLFWLESDGYYAQALDGNKKPVAVPNSNCGHLLACMLPAPERAARLIDRLTRPDLLTEWGIRTLSSEAPTYNPLSYHNGSIWPHDNSLIGYGFYRNGNFSAGNLVLLALRNAASSIPDNRLPELYCGLERTGIAARTPLPYPVSCSPQAWAAGTIPFLLRGLVEMHVSEGKLVGAGLLPKFLESVTMEGISVLGQIWSLKSVHSSPLAVAVEPDPSHS